MENISNNSGQNVPPETEPAEKKKKLNVHITAVCEATGWERSKARDEMDKARQYGVSYTAYEQSECWNMSEQEIIQLGADIANKKDTASAKEEPVQTETKKKKLNVHITAVCEATGWDRATAKEKMENAKQYGINYSVYVRNECWNMTSQQLSQLVEEMAKTKSSDTASSKSDTQQDKAKKQPIPKEKTKKKKLNVHITAVCEATGWDRVTAKEMMDKAREYGISYTAYEYFRCWLLCETELVQLGTGIAERKISVIADKENDTVPEDISRKKKNSRYIVFTSRATGWEKTKAREEMNKARSLGVSYMAYVGFECWNMSEEEIAAFGARNENGQIYIPKNEEEFLLHINDIRSVCRSTGWSLTEAKDRMDAAKAAGVDYRDYICHKGWEMQQEQLVALAAETEQRINLNRAEFIRLKTGWDKDFTEEKIRFVNSLEIPLETYVEKHMYLLTDEQLADFARIIREQLEKEQKDEEYYMSFLAGVTGWDDDKIRTELAKAELYDVGIVTYIRYGLWTYTGQKYDNTVERIVNSRKKSRSNKEKYIAEVSQVTGWSTGRTEYEINRAKSICGSSYEDYYAYRLYEVPQEKLNEYVTWDKFSRMRIKYNDYVNGNKYFNNKAVFNRTFDEFINRVWFENRNLSYEEFADKIKGLRSVIVKKIASTQGSGVYKFDVNISEEDNRQVYTRIMSLDPSIVEEYIVQHPETMKFCSDSVNTLRITTLYFNNECKFLYSIFRMGTKGAVVDNMHAGGIAAAVDMETGEVITNAVDIEGRVVEKHPASGLSVKGFRIPHWDRIIDVCKKATGRVEGVNLIGWDFAITPDGVDLIEGNPGASYIGAQVPFIEDRIGLSKVMVDPYL